jgi:hypothetical protein
MITAAVLMAGAEYFGYYLSEALENDILAIKFLISFVVIIMTIIAVLFGPISGVIIAAIEVIISIIIKHIFDYNVLDYLFNINWITANSLITDKEILKDYMIVVIMNMLFIIIYAMIKQMRKKQNAADLCACRLLAAWTAYGGFNAELE